VLFNRQSPIRYPNSDNQLFNSRRLLLMQYYSNRPSE
jgi:hypothetical protein